MNITETESKSTMKNCPKEQIYGKKEGDETQMTTVEEWAVRKIFSVLLNRWDFQFVNYSLVKIDSAA